MNIHDITNQQKLNEGVPGLKWLLKKLLKRNKNVIKRTMDPEKEVPKLGQGQSKKFDITDPDNLGGPMHNFKDDPAALAKMRSQIQPDDAEGFFRPRLDGDGNLVHDWVPGTNTYDKALTTHLKNKALKNKVDDVVQRADDVITKGKDVLTHPSFKNERTWPVRKVPESTTAGGIASVAGAGFGRKVIKRKANEVDGAGTVDGDMFPKKVIPAKIKNMPIDQLQMAMLKNRQINNPIWKTMMAEINRRSHVSRLEPKQLINKPLGTISQEDK